MVSFTLSNFSCDKSDFTPRLGAIFFSSWLAIFSGFSLAGFDSMSKMRRGVLYSGWLSTFAFRFFILAIASSGYQKKTNASQSPRRDFSQVDLLSAKRHSGIDI